MRNDGEFHLQLYATSPAPKRDYHGLTITSTQVILNSWDVSRGRHVYPRRRKMSLENVILDKGFCYEIQHLFGSHVLDYINRLVHKDKNLYSLSEKLFRKVIRYLAVSDIVKLRQTSKIFFEMCNTNDIWKIVFQKKLKRPPNKSELDISEVMSWRYMLKRKIMEKKEDKKIYERFKQGVEKLKKDTKKQADKLRNHSLSSKSEIFDRKPPEDIFKIQKLQIKTYKGTERPKTAIKITEDKTQHKTKPKTDKIENTSASKSSKHAEIQKPNKTVDKPTKEKEILVKHTTKVGSSKNINKTKTELKVENDLRTKSFCQLQKNDKVQDKKLNKSSKEIQNLKSKSVLL